MVNRSPEKMLRKNRKEIPSIDVEKKTLQEEQRRQTMPMVTFADVIRANWTSIDMKGQKRTRGHKPGRNVISLRSFDDIVSSTDREVNQDTGSKSTQETSKMSCQAAQR